MVTFDKAVELISEATFGGDYEAMLDFVAEEGNSLFSEYETNIQVVATLLISGQSEVYMKEGIDPLTKGRGFRCVFRTNTPKDLHTFSVFVSEDKDGCAKIRHTAFI